MKKHDHKQSVAANLRVIIAVIGGKQNEIARRIGSTPSKLGNWMRGDNYPDPWSMYLLCEFYGVTMDWIYRGKTYGLPVELVDGLKAKGEASPAE